MTNKSKAIAAVVLIVAAYGVNEYAKKKSLDEVVITAPVLKENEKQKIIVDTNKKTVTVVKRGPLGKGKDGKTNGTEVVKVTEGARKVVVTEDKDGTIHVTALNKGFCFEPGLALYYSNEARLGLDLQFAYYKKWGALLGAGINMGDEPRTVRLHLGVNYALPLDFMNNTTVFVALDNHKDVAAGLRIRF